MRMVTIILVWDYKNTPTCFSRVFWLSGSPFGLHKLLRFNKFTSSLKLLWCCSLCSKYSDYPIKRRLKKEKRGKEERKWRRRQEGWQDEERESQGGLGDNLKSSQRTNTPSLYLEGIEMCSLKQQHGFRDSAELRKPTGSIRTYWLKGPGEELCLRSAS